MPLYEYRCEKCKKKFELLRKVSDTTPVTCPNCGDTEIKKKASTFVTTGKAPRKMPWELS